MGTFQSDPSPLASHEEQYKAKPEITHMFREPEKRPSQTVSLAFTVLVCVPLLSLLPSPLPARRNESHYPYHLSQGNTDGLIAEVPPFSSSWEGIDELQHRNSLKVI